MKAFVEDVSASPLPPEQTVTLTMDVREFAALVLVVNAALSGNHSIRDGVDAGLRGARDGLHSGWRTRLESAESSSSNGWITDRVVKAFS